MVNIQKNASIAARLIKDADGLIITAGAGMGVDSGLPDFRGDQGFWNAYPALGSAGISFYDIATPRSFLDAPELAWGFYGHRLNLYRTTEPHDGFLMLLDIVSRLSLGAFVYTSNVDGQFQKAGFAESRVIECHGSIHYLQCSNACDNQVWSATNVRPAIDIATCRMVNEPPTCAHCQEIARPNILMFDDGRWLPQRKHEQQFRFRAWRALAQRPVIVEIGAGLSIPSVRDFGEGQGIPLIRINSREAEVERDCDVSLSCNGRTGIEAIFGALTDNGFFERPAQEAVDVEEWEY